MIGKYLSARMLFLQHIAFSICPAKARAKLRANAAGRSSGYIDKPETVTTDLEATISMAKPFGKPFVCFSWPHPKG